VKKELTSVRILNVNRGGAVIELTAHDCTILANACDAGGDSLAGPGGEEQHKWAEWCWIVKELFLALALAVVSRELMQDDHLKAVRQELGSFYGKSVPVE